MCRILVIYVKYLLKFKVFFSEKKNMDKRYNKGLRIPKLITTTILRKIG